MNLAYFAIESRFMKRIQEAEMEQDPQHCLKEFVFSYDILTSGKISSEQTASLPSLFIRSFSEIRVKMRNCRVKNYPHKNMVNFGQ